MIKAAAILQDGVTYTVPAPGRHHEVIRYMAFDRGFELPILGEQGFITDEGWFLDREEAAQHALECGQIKELNWPPLLFSEDLW